jgi:UDP-N-acetylglucosamine acyltransferase
MSCEIHQTAIIDANAKLGAGVTVGAYSVIGPHVEVGDRTRIGPHVVIEGRTSFGEECDIFQFSSIGSAPQDLKYHGEPSTLVIGARNKIREFVTIQPGTEHGRMTTQVGDNNLFMANSHVGHDCSVGSNNVFANSVSLAGHVTIESNVILGGMVGIHQFARVGNYAMLGAGSMVANDVPPYCIGQGDRCVLRGVNTIGLQRAGFSEEEIKAVRKVYRLLFAKVGGVKEKMNAIPEELVRMPRIAAMIEFIRSSSRGVASPSRS